MVFVIARFWGALLPYLAEFAIVSDGRAGMRTALLYLANIVGSATGSIVTGFVLMDLVGLIGLSCLLLLFSFMCVGLFAALAAMPRWQKMLRGGLAAVLALVCITLLPRLASGVLGSLQWKGAV